MKTRHVSVLCQEVIEVLRASEGGEYLDCTLGGGGHSAAILAANPRNTIFAIDRDLQAIERARERFDDPRIRFEQASFENLASLLSGQSFDGMLADLGTSMDQLHAGRGFSFHDDKELDMRMDQQQGITAAQLINECSEQELLQLLRDGGVGPEARAISQTIIAERPFDNAKKLAQVIGRVPSRKHKIHPATLAFQAIRIAVNREKQQVDTLLESAPQLLRDGGRLAVITFHSLEDKWVTKRFREWQGSGDAPAWYPGAKPVRRLGRLLQGKAVRPTQVELDANASSRSASLRVFEFQRDNH